jgi:tetratricopeptide (TPR) repeat protein
LRIPVLTIARKHRILAVAAFVILFLSVAVIIALKGPETSPVETIPEVADIGPSYATIAWRTDLSTSGRVFYRTVGSEKRPRSAGEALRPSYVHEVVIEGLEPGESYTYWLEGSGIRYRFRTPPPSTIAFSFLVTWGDVSSRIASLLVNENPDFILSLTPRYAGERDLFENAKPYVRIFEFDTPGSGHLRRGEELTRGQEWETWTLDWGGLRLVLFDGRTGMPESLEVSTAHTIGVVGGPGIVPSEADDERLAAAAIRSSSLHTSLVTYNEEFPSHPVAFVLVTRSDLPVTTLDEIHYLGVPIDEASPSGALRIDVSMESTVGVFLDEGREVALRRPALRQKRTCEECRHLADQGAYEESVLAYQEFIETHEGHFQIDDAYFAIAEILDENLFRYAQALEWYQGLLEKYPRSSLVPLARQRLNYLTEHSDYEFEPLARFERIRSVEFARKKDSFDELEPLLAEVRAILTDFPDCRLAPDMTYWLANQFRRSDPDRAVEIYQEFIGKYPHHPNADSVRLEIGETYYDARRYHDAIRAYEAVITAAPSQAGSAEVQIARAKRNLRRRSLAWVGWMTLIVVLGLGVLWPPAGFSAQKFSAPAVTCVILTFVVVIAGWLIREQFSSTREIVTLALAFAASASLGYPFSSAFAEKAFRIKPGEGGNGKGMVSDILGTVLGILFFVAGTYLTVYHVNEHFLILIGL